MQLCCIYKKIILLQQKCNKMQLRNTKSKEEVWRILSKSDYALSHTEIEIQSALAFDRVTLYRILSGFEQQGVVHKIVGNDGKARYATCKSKCTDHEHHKDNHLHFGCNDCGKMYCFDNKTIELKMPNGFKAEQFNYTVFGTCPDCN
jgi:Fur family ferric uptake transcriptional regulator